MGFFSNLFGKKAQENSKTVSQQVAVQEKEDDNWETIPKWIKVDDPDERRKIALIASSIAKYDDNGKEYILNNLEKRSPEYRKLGIIVASTINFMVPNSTQSITSIKKAKS